LCVTESNAFSKSRYNQPDFNEACIHYAGIIIGIIGGKKKPGIILDDF